MNIFLNSSLRVIKRDFLRWEEKYVGETIQKKAKRVFKFEKKVDLSSKHMTHKGKKLWLHKVKCDALGLTPSIQIFAERELE